MRGTDALSYCRQLLFEQRLTNVWATTGRLRLVAAIERWKMIPAWYDDANGLAGAERQRWREEIEHERVTSLERIRRESRQTHAKLEAALGVISELRADNEALRHRELSAMQHLELEELEEHRKERTLRVAAGSKAVLQETELRSRLEVEQRRLADGSAQLASLEAIAEQDQASIRLRQQDEEVSARRARDAATTAFRAVRTHGGRTKGSRSAPRLAWRAAYAHARLRAAWSRHESELSELEERLAMLEGLRESRDALEWRVTQTKAELIVLRSASSAAEPGHGHAGSSPSHVAALRPGPA